MTDREKQSRFVKLQGQLIAWAYDNGYELTEGEGYRTNEQALIYSLDKPRLNALIAILKSNAFYDLAQTLEDNRAGAGVKLSYHGKRLAVDFNVFKNGVYLTDTKDLDPLGTFWKSLDPLCRWGGDFKKPDGNHFSYGE